MFDIKFEWTEEAVEDLKRLYQDGMSMRAIAQALGATSRNAVIGKVNRMGFSRSKTPGEAMAEGAEMSRAQIKIAPGKRDRQLASGECEAARRIHTRSGVQVPPPVLPVAKWIDGETANDAPPSKVKLFDLHPSSCRWPYGDPHSADLVFCGREALDGMPYCAEHCARAYHGRN
jgi:GcrA cell cycle regulator